MAENSAIEWTDATWNPVTGCTKISAGCDNCYAARFSERFRGVRGHPFETGFDLTLRPERLKQPLEWKRPRMIFVNSMSDLFHKDIPKAHIEAVFDTMERADWHVYQVLTKRSSLMQKFVNDRYRDRKAPRAYLVWRVGRKRAGYIAHRASTESERGRTLPVHRTSHCASRTPRPPWHRLGHRRRRERPPCATDEPGMGNRRAQPMCRRSVSLSFSSNGADARQKPAAACLRAGNGTSFRSAGARPAQPEARHSA